jgi:hypothetical protein
LTILLGEVELQDFDFKDKPILREKTSSGYIVSVRDVATFLIQDDRIIINRLTSRIELIESVLLSEIFPILLSLKGNLIIQGAAISVKSKAFLLIGPAGIGKSAILAALHERGYTVLSDQVNVISTIGKGQLRLIPSLTKLKLWEDSLQLLNLKFENLEKVREELPKYYFNANTRELESTYEISGIIILKINDLISESELKSFELSTFECLRYLLENTIDEKPLFSHEAEKSIFKKSTQLSSTSFCRLIVRPYSVLNIISFANFIETELKKWEKI